MRNDTNNKLEAPRLNIGNKFDLIKKVITSEPNPFRFRQGKVITYTGGDTIDVQIGGAVDENNNVVTTSGIKLFGNFVPSVDQAIWLVTDGLDIFAIGQLFPYGTGSTGLQGIQGLTGDTGADGIAVYETDQAVISMQVFR